MDGGERRDVEKLTQFPSLGERELSTLNAFFRLNKAVLHIYNASSRMAVDCIMLIGRQGHQKKKK